MKIRMTFLCGLAAWGLAGCVTPQRQAARCRAMWVRHMNDPRYMPFFQRNCAAYVPVPPAAPAPAR
ncbi:MAG: hypothetical protein ACHQ2Z_12270 [Elusimicrobiota bacterium]